MNRGLVRRDESILSVPHGILQPFAGLRRALNLGAGIDVKFVRRFRKTHVPVRALPSHNHMMLALSALLFHEQTTHLRQARDCRTFAFFFFFPVLASRGAASGRYRPRGWSISPRGKTELRWRRRGAPALSPDRPSDPRDNRNPGDRPIHRAGVDVQVTQAAARPSRERHFALPLAAGRPIAITTWRRIMTLAAEW